MAGIPQNFQSLSPVLTNYNFVDIASGTGYITFYAGKTVDLNLLSNFTYYSDSILTNIAITGVNYTLQSDVDFDILLNRPLDLRGTGIISIPIYAISQTFVYLDIKLRKWDGITETEIINNISTVFNPGVTGYQMLTTDLIIPITHFKQGETLRVSVLVYAKHAGGAQASGSIKYAHDPKSRLTGWDSTGAVPSQLTFQCPVRLNL